MFRVKRVPPVEVINCWWSCLILVNIGEQWLITTITSNLYGHLTTLAWYCGSHWSLFGLRKRAGWVCWHKSYTLVACVWRCLSLYYKGTSSCTYRFMRMQPRTCLAVPLRDSKKVCDQWKVWPQKWGVVTVVQPFFLTGCPRCPFQFISSPCFDTCFILSITSVITNRWAIMRCNNRHLPDDHKSNAIWSYDPFRCSIKMKTKWIMADPHKTPPPNCTWIAGDVPSTMGALFTAESPMTSFKDARSSTRGLTESSFNGCTAVIVNKIMPPIGPKFFQCEMHLVDIIRKNRINWVRTSLIQCNYPYMSIPLFSDTPPKKKWSDWLAWSVSTLGVGFRPCGNSSSPSRLNPL